MQHNRLAALCYRAGAIGVALMLLGNNIIAAQGNMPTIVAMIAVATIPLFVRRNAWSVALAVSFVGLYLYSLPAAVGRAGSHIERESDARTLALRTAQEARDHANNLKQKAEQECATGIGPLCIGKTKSYEAAEARAGAAENEVSNAPAPDGYAIIAGMWGADSHVLRTASVAAFALASELAIAALLALALGLPSSSSSRAAPEVVSDTKESEPTKAPDWIRWYIANTDAPTAKEAYQQYKDAWKSRGVRTMSEDRFVHAFQRSCRLSGLEPKTHAGNVVYLKVA